MAPRGIVKYKPYREGRKDRFTVLVEATTTDKLRALANARNIDIGMLCGHLLQEHLDAEPVDPLVAYLKRTEVELLTSVALSQGKAVGDFCGELLSNIVQGNLFKAILDVEGG